MKISIITACKNSGKTLERTLDSICNQKYKEIEFIVVDGRSVDDTLKILNRYNSCIDTLISEPDTGIYNAMNKGLKNATGDIVYFLNSDDYFCDNRVVKDVADKFMQNDQIDILYGNILMSDGSVRKRVRYNTIDKKYFYKSTVCHQSIFAKMHLFTKIGLFDEKFVIHADTDWLMKAYFNSEINFAYLDRDITVFSTKGFCSDPVYAEKYKLDRQKISAKYFMEAKIKLYIKMACSQLGLAK